MSVVSRLMKVALVASASSSTIAVAQTAPPPLTSPVEEAVDSNGVDLVTGKLRAVFAQISIGNASQGGIALRQSIDVPNNLEGNVSCDSTSCKVTVGNTAEQFTKSGSAFIPVEKNGSTLTFDGVTYVFKTSDGTAASFSIFYGRVYNQISTGGPTQYDRPQSPPSNYAGITSVQSPDGDSLNYYYTEVDRRPSSMYAPLFRIRRIQSITSSSGYQLKYTYQSDDSSNIFGANGQMFQWSNRVKATLLNNRTDSCAVTAFNCSIPDRPYLLFSGGMNNDYSQVVPNSVTDAEGKVTSINSTSSTIAIQPPGGVSPLSYTLDGSGRVSQTSVGGVITNYSYPSDSSYRTTTRTTLAGTETYRFGLGDSLLRQRVDVSGAVTTYAYNASLQLDSVTAPDGNWVKYARDDRGNATTTTYYPKPGSAEQPIVTSAGYEATCPASIAARCNQPNWVRDGRNKQTDYSYDDTTGVVRTVLRPAAQANAPRPKMAYDYTTVDGVRRLTGVTTCLTATDCPGSSSERKVTMSYGARATNNIELQAVRVSAGDNSVSATQTFTYTPLGDIDTVDGPLPGAGDTSRILYDLAMRRVKGRIAPDPDGGGSGRPVASRLTYDGAGRLQRTELGPVDGQADSQWSSFQPLIAEETVYDGYGRVVQSRTSGGGIAASLVETSYDSAGRVECVAQRMNAGALTAAPASACTAGAPGADGPDRITRTTYDAAARRTEVTSGYGTADASTDVTVLTTTGKLSWVRDAELNRTSYVYDGHDRLSQTRYPASGKGSDASSSGDYEALTYDANSNILSRLLRGGQRIDYSYDDLNRLTNKVRPKTAYWETDQSFDYDLLGQMTRAADSNGRVLTFAYDALGRKVSQGDNWYTYGNATFQYDPAGHRTRFTWGDGAWVGYEYRPSGEMSAIRDSAGSALVTFAYDALARRSSLSRANGTTTGYVFDSASRLAQLSQYRGSETVLEQRYAFGYNPAQQIASRTVDNDSYAWNGHYNVDRSYGTNGLNQLTSAGPTALGYDARGNLVTSGTSSYGYTADNELATAPGAALAYDPAGRLFNINAEAGINTTLTYDGSDLMAEINQANGALLRRYVYGPRIDEPLIWYEGSAFNDKRWLHADERGSIVSITNDVGAVVAINRYDEFGIPAAGNLGRFQYTGQKWLPSVGLYDYKARMYSPTLGRFMQTDPIGYGDGLNQYNYVDSDPINNVDPSGMAGCPAGVLCATLPATYPSTPAPSPPSRGGGGFFLNPIPIVKGIVCLIFGCKKTKRPATPAVAAPPPAPVPAMSVAPQNGRYRNSLDPCNGKGTNEGAGVPAGYDPYKVDVFGSLAAIQGHVVPLHSQGAGVGKSEFSPGFSNPTLLASVISTVIQTPPARGGGGALVYTVNTGQYAGYDARNGGQTQYITVVMGPKVNGYRTLKTAYPGCR